MPTTDRRLRRTSIAASAVLATALLVTTLLAGCGSSPPGGSPTTPATPASAAATGDSLAPSGSPVGSAGDPCSLVNAADIKSAFGVSVTKVIRLPESTDTDGTSQQCVYSTTGPPVTSAGVDMLRAIAEAFGGSGDAAKLDTAGVGVILFAAKPETPPETPDVADLPPGSKEITGLGDYAVIVPSAIQTGGAAVCLQGNRAVIVLSIEGRATPVDQLEQLLRTAVGRMRSASPMARPRGAGSKRDSTQPSGPQPATVEWKSPTLRALPGRDRLRGCD